MLETKNLSKHYYNGYRQIIALDKVSLSFEKGKVYGVVGHNGAGKTTLIKLLCGLVFPTYGFVYINKKSLYPKNFELLSNIGAILEGSRNIFWNLTPLQNVKYFSMLRGLSYKNILPVAKSYFEIFELEDKLNTPVRNLSQGMKQKLAIIVSLLHNPEILLLDEPTLGLDPNSSYSMQKLIRDIAVTQKKLVIITSHQLNLIEKLSDELVLLSKGSVCYFGSIKNFVTKKSEQVYILTVTSRDDKTFNKEILKYKPKLERIGGEIFATIRIPESDLDQVLTHLVYRNTKILNIEKQNSSLEEVFLKEVAK